MLRLAPDDLLPLTCTREGACCFDARIWITPWELAVLARLGRVYRLWRRSQMGEGVLRHAARQGKGAALREHGHHAPLGNRQPEPFRIRRRYRGAHRVGEHRQPVRQEMFEIEGGAVGWCLGHACAYGVRSLKLVSHETKVPATRGTAPQHSVGAM